MMIFIESSRRKPGTRSKKANGICCLVRWCAGARLVAGGRAGVALFAAGFGLH
jgi:hypothetical protein